MLDYQRPGSDATLDEGLKEYYCSRDGLVEGRGISQRARLFFARHDAAHVVFGCSTELLDEAKIKMWSLFGTTGGLALLREYGLPESKEIYQTLELRPIVSTALRSVVVAPRVFARCRRMTRKWPWAGYEQYGAVPLSELRANYGIQLLV